MRLDILVIDDDKDLRENISEILSLTGHGVMTAVNGREGFDKAVQFLPDVIISDIMMPDTNGVMFLKLLKKENTTKDIPLIFMSGAAIPTKTHQSILTEGYQYLSKPFTEEQLLIAVDKCLILKKV